MNKLETNIIAIFITFTYNSSIIRLTLTHRKHEKNDSCGYALRN